MGPPGDEKTLMVSSAVSTQYINVTDRQTDRQTDDGPVDGYRTTNDSKDRAMHSFAR